MVQIAIVSDIHSNLEALEAVLAHIEEQDIDKIVNLGDSICYGADPAAVLERIQNFDVNLRGFLDYGIATQSYTEAATHHRWTREQVSGKLTKIPQQLVHTLDDAIFFYAFPTRNPVEWRDRHVPLEKKPTEVFDKMKKLGYRLGFSGYTHTPWLFKPDHSIPTDHAKKEDRVGELSYELTEGPWLVCVGSVGQPRDGDRRAAYATFDTESKTVKLFRVPYDFETAARKIKAADLPERVYEGLKLGY